jgi:hypothetical protein
VLYIVSNDSISLYEGMESKCMKIVAVVAYFEMPLLYFPKMLENDHENSDSEYLVCVPKIKHGTFRIQYKLTMT